MPVEDHPVELGERERPGKTRPSYNTRGPERSDLASCVWPRGWLVGGLGQVPHHSGAGAPGGCSGPGHAGHWGRHTACALTAAGSDSGPRAAASAGGSHRSETRCRSPCRVGTRNSVGSWGRGDTKEEKGWRRQPRAHVCPATPDMINSGAFLAVCPRSRRDACPPGLGMAPVNVLSGKWEFEAGQCGVSGR